MTIDTPMLTAMRTAINRLLPDTCNLLTVTRSVDAGGGFVESWGTASANVACRLDKMSGSEQLAGGALLPFTGWMLSLPYDTTITEAYRVEHGGYTYAVESVNNDSSWQAVKRAQVKRV
jgi:hypothetical protein